MIGMAVAGDNHLPWPSVALLHDDLMSDAPAGGVKVHSMLLCKRFNLAIFCLVGCRFVLYVMVESEYWLTRIIEFRAVEGEEFGDDGSGVIVGHAGVSEHRRGDLTHAPA